MRVSLFRNNAFIKFLRIFACVALTILSGATSPYVYATVMSTGTAPKTVGKPLAQPARIVLPNVPDDLIPQQSNIWKCTCDTDGCWPGCFTIASASIAKYWSLRGYPNLWNGDENGTFARLRDLFPNLFCYDNVNGDGKPSESGYDAYDVAAGFSQFLSERGYRFAVTALPNPSFEQVMAEIDAGRPIIGAFTKSPWGSHAATIIGYDTTGGKQIMIVRPNLFNKKDVDLTWNVGYGGFGIVTVIPQELPDLNNPAALSSPTSITDTLAAPIAPAAYELIVNDADTGFAMRGSWTTANGAGFAGETHYRQTTDPTNLGPQDDSASVTWTPEIPFDGIWQVLVYMPITDTEDSTAHNAIYRVTHAEGMNLIRRAPHQMPQGWVSLGDFPFTRGVSGTVYLGDKTGDDLPRTLYADAMRFMWRAPLLIRSEDSAQLYLVTHGRRHAIPDDDTFGALRLSKSNIRVLSTVAFLQYPEGEPLPSVYSGWVGQYFNNSNLAFPASLVRADGSLRFRWSGTAPAANLDATNFSVRWSRVFALSEGEYPFTVNAIGGVRLWVDGQLQIDAWDAPEQLLAHQKSIGVASGLHRVELEYRAGSSFAQVELGNLPPNAPIIIDSAPVQWSTNPTVTMEWADAGDADSIDKGRRFFVTLWREEQQRNVWQTTSGWITDTQWTTALPADGRYQWSVVASDGTLNSSATAPRTFLLDRTAPWAQMQSAQARSMTSTLQQPKSNAVEITGDLRGAEVIADIEGRQSLVINQRSDSAVAAREVISAYGNLPAVHLTWWATDTLSGLGTYDVQARVLVRANTVYTLSTVEQQVPRLTYELVLSGSQEISQPVVVTDTMVFSTVVPLIVFEPLSPTEWVTVAIGLSGNTMLFLGEPGSTYEFRVRARDNAGNEQPWYEGYSVQVEIDPKTLIYRRFLPLVESDRSTPIQPTATPSPRNAATVLTTTQAGVATATPEIILLSPGGEPGGEPISDTATTTGNTAVNVLPTTLPVQPTPEGGLPTMVPPVPTETPLPTQAPPVAPTQAVVQPTPQSAPNNPSTEATSASSEPTPIP